MAKGHMEGSLPIWRQYISEYQLAGEGDSRGRPSWGRKLVTEPEDGSGRAESSLHCDTKSQAPHRTSTGRSSLPLQCCPRGEEQPLPSCFVRGLPGAHWTGLNGPLWLDWEGQEESKAKGWPSLQVLKQSTAALWGGAWPGILSLLGSLAKEDSMPFGGRGGADVVPPQKQTPPFL